MLGCWSSCSCMPGSGSGNTNCPDYGAWRLRACRVQSSNMGPSTECLGSSLDCFFHFHFTLLFIISKLIFVKLIETHTPYTHTGTRNRTRLQVLSYTFKWTFLAWNIWRRNATNYVVDVVICVNSHRSLVAHLLVTLLPAYFVLKSRNLGLVTLMRRGPLCPVKYGVWLRAIGTSGGHFVTLELLVKICRGMQRVSSCMDLILWEF